jgi:hypothetical protein
MHERALKIMKYGMAVRGIDWAVCLRVKVLFSSREWRQSWWDVGGSKLIQTSPALLETSTALIQGVMYVCLGLQH